MRTITLVTLLGVLMFASSSITDGVIVAQENELFEQYADCIANCNVDCALAMIESEHEALGLGIHQIGQAINLIDSGGTAYCQNIAEYVIEPGNAYAGAACIELYDGATRFDDTDVYYVIHPGGDSNKSQILDIDSQWLDIVNAFLSEDTCYPDYSLPTCTAETLVTPTLLSPSDYAHVGSTPILSWDLNADCQPDSFYVSLIGSLDNVTLISDSGALNSSTTTWAPDSPLECGTTYSWAVIVHTRSDSDFTEQRVTDYWSFEVTEGTDCTSENSTQNNALVDSLEIDPMAALDGINLPPVQFSNSYIPIAQGNRAHAPTEMTMNALVESAGGIASYTESVILFGSAISNQYANGNTQGSNNLSNGVDGSFDPQGDNDDDGTPNALDLCPYEYGIFMTGCPESFFAETNQFVTGDPPLPSEDDRDGDGVPNVGDDCPDTSGAPHMKDLSWFNGCPDGDHDYIPDYMDLCPHAPATNLTGCPDTDGDGLIDIEDACPSENGESMNLGCPWEDYDGDGVGDEADVCFDIVGEIQYLGCPWDANDTDGDGWNNYADPCPESAGSANGCPDGDNDGIADFLDECPDEVGHPGSTGCPATDTDNDGILDFVDQCPDAWGEAGGNTMGCPDDDGDGIVNVWDVCPEIPGQHTTGCPDSDDDGVVDSQDVCPNTKGVLPLFGCPIGSSISTTGITEVYAPEDENYSSPQTIVAEGHSFPCLQLSASSWYTSGADGNITVLTQPNCQDDGYSVGTVVQILAQPDTGSFLQGLQGCGVNSTQPQATFTLTRSCAIVANFVPSLCFDIDLDTIINGGTGSLFLSAPENCPHGSGYAVGSEVGVMVRTDQGQFQSITSDCYFQEIISPDQRHYTIPAIHSDCHIEATFTDELVCHNITFGSINDGGSGRVNYNVAVAKCGNGGYWDDTQIRVRAEPDPGSEFAGWYGCGLSDEESELVWMTASEDCQVQARFTGSAHQTNGIPSCTSCHITQNDVNNYNTMLPPDSIPFTGDSDYDGDMIIDRDDQCIDEPGIAALFGCPMAVLHIANNPSFQLAGYGTRTSTIAPFAQTGLYTNTLGDQDADGIPNGIDDCPNTAGEFILYGCPAEMDEKAGACAVQAGQQSITVRVGPGFHRGIFATIIVEQDSIDILGYAEADDGSLWWEIDKTQIPGSTSAVSLWVNQSDIATSGNCETIISTNAPPVIYASSPDSALPEAQSGPVADTAADPQRDDNGWGFCGTCNSCAGPEKECRLTPDNQCVWDPGSCQNAGSTSSGGESSGSSSTCYNVGTNINYAGFPTQGSISISPGPNCGGQYQAGTSVTFNVNGAPGGAGVFWGGCGTSGTGMSKGTTINGNCTATATYYAN